MSVVARITVPAEAFPLGELLEVRPGVRVRLEPMVPTGTTTVPYFWVDTGDAAAVEAALEASALVEDVRVVDEADGETLFGVAWSAEVNGLLEVIAETAGVVLRGTGEGDDWSFRLRFPDRVDLSAFYWSCSEAGIPLELREVYDASGGDRDSDVRLTDEQREALAAALEAGYFAVPRRTTLGELAERLGISDTAASQRIRRGLAALLSATLGVETAANWGPERD